MRQNAFIVTFIVVALVILGVWVVLLFSESDHLPGATVLMTSVVGGCVTLASKAQKAEDE